MWNPFRRADRDRPLHERLAELERQSEEASLAYRSQYLNRAGDICMQAGERKRALRYWGQAIDAYLNVARPEAAAALCRKVIRQAPEVVRARRTLALLAIGQGHLSDAIEQVEGYVRAAEEVGRRELCVKQLRLMGEATWSTRFRRRIAELLQELGDAKGAAYVARALPAEEEPEENALSEKAHDRWATILRVALMTPQEATDYL